MINKKLVSVLTVTAVLSGLLSGRYNAPILFCGNSLSDNLSIIEFINSTLPSGGNVVILGGGAGIKTDL